MWNDLKEKEKQKQLNFSYFHELLEKLITCFEYENTPQGIDESFLEMYLLINGHVGISKSQSNASDYVCYIGGYCGDLNEYGLGTSYVGSTTGYSYEGVIGQDLVVGLNNKLKMGRTNLLNRYSGLLANIEESINIGIINSRLLDVVECENDADVEQLKSISNQLKRGELVGVSGKLSSIFEDKQRFKKLDINDKASVDKLQYYSRFYEDTLKRLWLESGIEITNKDKSAQVNNEELNAFSNYSRITIEDMLHCREKMCNDFNSLFGGNWSVKLSHIFDNQETQEDGNLIDYDGLLKESDKNGNL